MQPLHLPGTLDSLAPVSEFVKSAAAEAGLDKHATYRLRLAVVELVTNVIEHGYAENGLSGWFDVSSELAPETLTVTIEDDAPAFDPRQADVPDDLHLPPEERQIGGLGVYLVLQEVDRYEYERRDGRNRSVVVMNRPNPTSGPPLPAGERG